MIQYQLIRAKYSLLSFLKKEYSDPKHGHNIIGLLQEIFVFVGFGGREVFGFFPWVFLVCWVFCFFNACMHAQEKMWMDPGSQFLIYLEQFIFKSSNFQQTDSHIFRYKNNE